VQADLQTPLQNAFGVPVVVDREVRGGTFRVFVTRTSASGVGE